jgi:hypothetical protein
VHNRGLTDVPNAVVELYWKDSSQLDLAAWPEGWQPVDDDGDPATAPVFRHFISVPAQGSATTTFLWVPPRETSEATLLVRVRHLQDPIRILRNPAERFEPDRYDNNVAARRIVVTPSPRP